MRSVLLIMCVAMVAAMLGCAGEQETAGESGHEESELAGRVNDWVVTKDEVQSAIDQQPTYDQQKLNTPAGRATVTYTMIQDELFYQEALRQGLKDDPEVQKAIEAQTRSVLINAYFKDFVQSEARPTEEEIHDYYESHQDRYTMLAVGRGQHIFSKDRKKLEELKERVIEGGEKFTTLAHQYSEDEQTRRTGGDLGYFNPGGYVVGFGYNHAISDSMFEMEIGKIYGPIKWEKGYSLIRVNERRDATVKPYDEVRDEIVNTLTAEKIEEAKTRVTMRILPGYNVRNYFEDAYKNVQRSPTELFNLAQNAQDPRDKINAYQEIVDKFPDDDFAPKALFMVGFVYAEELEDYLTADRVFAQVVQRYPDTDIADQASWMQQNLQSGSPDFEDIDTPVDN